MDMWVGWGWNPSVQKQSARPRTAPWLPCMCAWVTLRKVGHVEGRVQLYLLWCMLPQAGAPKHITVML